MGKPIIPFHAHEWNRMRDSFRIFREGSRSDSGPLLIGASDLSALKSKLGCKIEKLSDFRSDAVVVFRTGLTPELFVDPRSSSHRDMQFSFLERIGVFMPSNEVAVYQSDHVLPVSAVTPAIGLVKAQLIPGFANGSYGSILEKFRKGRMELFTGGVVQAAFPDLLKILGLPLNGSDIEENLQVGKEMIIGSGIGSEKDRSFLEKSSEDGLIDVLTFN